MKFVRLVAVLAVVLGVASCGSSETSGPASSVGAIAINPPSPTLALNATLALQAEVKDASGAVVDNAVVVWSVRDANIVSVSSTGLVTALALGTTQVAASSQGKSALTTVTVQRIPVATVVVRPDRVDAVVGSRTQLTATTLDAGQNTLVGRGIIWSTSNAGVATVDATGLVTGVASGTAVITATSEGKSAPSTFNIIPGAVASVIVAPSPITMVAGQSTQLAASARDAAGSVVLGRPVIWSSSNTAVASVTQQGVVTAVGAGSTSITATIDGVSGASAITVSNVAVSRVTVAPQSPSLTSTSSIQLTARVVDANGAIVTDRIVTWVSSNPAIATVSSTGVLTGVGPGTVTITATSEGKSGSTTATVTLVPVGSVKVVPSSLSLTPGQTAALSATVTDANGTVVFNRPVTWSTSDASIATVTPAGVVTAKGAGSATITAASGGQSGSASVTVGTTAAGSVRVSPSTVTLAAGQGTTLTATVLDSNGAPVPAASIAWSTSNAQIADVTSGGVVTTATAGTATITATSGTVSGTAMVTVVPGPAASVTITPSDTTVKKKKSVQLTAVAKDAKGNVITGRLFNWQPQNSLYFDISPTGVVTGTQPTVFPIIGTAFKAGISAELDGVFGAGFITVTP